MSETPIENLTRAEAAAELPDLIRQIEAANTAYHTLDAPEISDAEYDALKRRLAAIEARFPDLKSSDSPTEKVGAGLAEGFGKIRHEQRMMSLGNAFDPEEVSDFDQSIRKFLKLSDDAPLAYTAEPKIDGIS